MAYSLNNSVLWAQSMLGTYIPLSSQTGSEPAISIANMVTSFMVMPPFSFPWNRVENTAETLTVGEQDILCDFTDFGWLEKVTLNNPTSGTAYEIKNVYNANILGASTEELARPNACCVKLFVPNTSVTFRFLSAPDLAYPVTFAYQKIPYMFTALANDWFVQAGIPYFMMPVFNNLFLSECFIVNGDVQEAATYRRRGMAALVAMADGLTEAQRNMIMLQAVSGDLQIMAAQLRQQMASQARTI